MNRRAFMRRVAGGLAAASLGPEVRAFGAGRGKPPNIVIILADDMGFSDLGCYGSEIATPHLDGLASEGIRFTQAYCAARCCPSRASLLTGLYPHQAGMGDMVSTEKKARPAGPYQGYLNRSCVTVAEVLRGSGYRTYMSGKWHVGERPEHWPRRRGFDRYFGLISGASSYFELLNEESPRRVMARDDTPYVPGGDDFYMTDAFTENAIRYLEEHEQGKPFLLYLAYTAPHWPLHARKEDVARYRGKYKDGWDVLRTRRYQRQLELGIINPKWALSPRDAEVSAWETVENKDEWDLRMSVYAAMVSRLDYGVGRVMETLKRLGMEENTLVLFLSDNGGCHERIHKANLTRPGAVTGERGSHVAYERNWANLSNTPFRMFKHWCHEGGISTPLIARWPGGIQGRGKLTHEVAHIIDILPTCLEVAGGAYPESFEGSAITPTPGKSLAPIFAGKGRAPHERLYWEHEGNRALREGRWKLVATKEGDWELYDLEADRTELRNLSDTEGDRAKRMNAAWGQWATSCGVNMSEKG